ncbi:hypothetical protein GCM10007857_83700 [Bradyrhizobium iriomotense]|uniref:Uncharacterized protein n=1 Tax=Bradyrhizobium iriomotense TaxID=441950 RepID=A0ABQ6BHG4_9BRAD|nr:hypothetical protein GCM10007857_83700 [Bradyrhizobium iriomotense]
MTVLKAGAMRHRLRRLVVLITPDHRSVKDEPEIGALAKPASCATGLLVRLASERK